MHCDRLATVRSKCKHSVEYEETHNMQLGSSVVHAFLGLRAISKEHSCLICTCGSWGRGRPRVESAYHLKRMQ